MGIVSLLVFIAVTVLVNVVLHRNIAEALLLALVACAVLGGTDGPRMLYDGIIKGSQSDVVYAGVAFVFMGVIVQATGLIHRLITILNSVFGRVRGGAAYVSTFGSALIGLVAGNTAGNAATVGSVTIPWMKETGWSNAKAASLVAGNSGLGVALPPNSTMFILLALPAAAGATSSGVYVALACAGAYAVLYRLGVVWLWTRRDGIPPTPVEDREPFGQAVREGWKSPLIFIGLVLPVILTVGPLSDWLAREENIGEGGVGSISIIVWVPVLITLIALVEGWKIIRREPKRFLGEIRGEVGQFATVGVSLFASLAAASIMEDLGVGTQLADFLTSFSLGKWAMLLLVVIVVVIVATPLSSTATAAAIGAPAIAALTSVGIDPTVAIIVVLLCTSTEGASPPMGAPLFLAAGMAEAKPVKMFMPLAAYFVLPMMVLAWLVGMGYLPIYVPA